MLQVDFIAYGNKLLVSWNKKEKYLASGSFSTIYVIIVCYLKEIFDGLTGPNILITQVEIKVECLIKAI